jgi:Na+/pantothenate symporter
MMFLALALTFIGCIALCLAMARHHRQVWGQIPNERTTLKMRCVGWFLLIIAIWICIDALGGPLGFVAWFGLFTLSSVVLIFALPYVPGLPWKFLASRSLSGKNRTAA